MAIRVRQRPLAIRWNSLTAMALCSWNTLERVTISFTLQVGVEYSIVLQASMATGNTTALSSMNVWLGTPVPAPAALALFGIAGLASKCRRK